MTTLIMDKIVSLFFYFVDIEFDLFWPVMYDKV